MGLVITYVIRANHMISLIISSTTDPSILHNYSPIWLSILLVAFLHLMYHSGAPGFLVGSVLLILLAFCVVFLFCLSWYCVLCTLYCQFLWIVHFSLAFRCSLTFMSATIYFSHFWDRPVPIFSDVRFSFLTLWIK